jgi:hypothetical protein
MTINVLSKGTVKRFRKFGKEGNGGGHSLDESQFQALNVTTTKTVDSPPTTEPNSLLSQAHFSSGGVVSIAEILALLPGFVERIFTCAN